MLIVSTNSSTVRGEILGQTYGVALVGKYCSDRANRVDSN